jgi:hypothetical protein
VSLFLQACNNSNPCPINCTGSWEVLNASLCTGAGWPSTTGVATDTALYVQTMYVAPRDHAGLLTRQPGAFEVLAAVSSLNLSQVLAKQRRA